MWGNTHVGSPDGNKNIVWLKLKIGIFSYHNGQPSENSFPVAKTKTWKKINFRMIGKKIFPMSRFQEPKNLS